MVADMVYGVSTYYSIFKSPLKNYQVNPATNLMYGAMANKVYTQTVAKKVQSAVSSYLSSLNSGISDLKASVKSLATAGPDSSFNQKSVSSSDEGAVTGLAASNADAAAYTLNVSKLAKGQTNLGSRLVSDGKPAFSAGLNTFSLKLGSNNEKRISFTIDQNDTNKSGLEKMAKAINSAKIGVTAGVFSDAKTGTSFLKLSSDNTGISNAFSLSDVNGNSVAASGIGTVSQQAQDAEFTLNGEKRTSSGNTVSLNNSKVQVTLNKADGKDIKLTVGTDTKAIASDIRDFVGSYNDVISFAGAYATTLSGAGTLQKELGDIVKARQHSLENMGINTNADGTLSIDEKKLESAISQNPAQVKDVLGGYNGVAEKLYAKSTDVLSAPLKYSTPTEVTGDASSFYNNLSGVNRSMYARNMYAGLVVDTLL